MVIDDLDLQAVRGCVQPYLGRELAEFRIAGDQRADFGAQRRKFFGVLFGDLRLYGFRHLFFGHGVLAITLARLARLLGQVTAPTGDDAVAGASAATAHHGHL